MANTKCRACGRTQQEHIDTPTLDHVFDMVLPSVDIRTMIRRLDNQQDLWETALNATDTAIREAALSGLLHPAAPEVDTLKRFFSNMRARYAAEREVLEKAAALLPAPAMTFYSTPSKGKSRRL